MIKYADKADDLALLANACAQAKSQQHCHKHTAGGIDLSVNAIKKINVF